MIEEDEPTIPKVGARRIPFGHSRFYGTSSFACLPASFDLVSARELKL